MLSKMYQKNEDPKKKSKKISYKGKSDVEIEPTKEAKMRMMAMIGKKK